MGDQVLDGLMEVFPLVNFSMLIDVSTKFKDDIDAAADYVIQNILPNMVPHPSHPNTNEDLYIRGLQQVLGDTSTHLRFDPVDGSTNSNSVQFDPTNKIIVENEDSLLVKQLKQSSTDLCSDVFCVPSTSGQNCVSEEVRSHSLLAGSQLQHSRSERNSEISASEGDMSLHNNGSPDVTVRSNYSVNLESLDDVIADEHYKKITLVSNVAAISEMLHEVELKEEKTKHVISEASQAGNDILVKVEELKEMATLVVEDNKKVLGEIFAEKSILATETQELQTRLFNISEETKGFMLTIDEMHKTLQRRLAAAEVERAAAEKAKLEREASAQKALKEHEFTLEAANKESKRLEEQAQENAKLKELLMDRGHVVDALHGEMLGKPLQHISTSLSSSAVGQPPQQVSSSLSCSAVNEPLPQADPSNLSTSVRSSSSKSSSVEPLASKSGWSSAAESNASLKDDEMFADISDGNFALDDSWDVLGHRNRNRNRNP